jgi:hypothetical protein
LPSIGTLPNKLIVPVVQVAGILFILVFLFELPSGQSAIAQVTITPGTNNQDQAAPEPEAAPEPDQKLPQQTTPGPQTITQDLDYAHFVPLTNSPGNQVKLLLNYTVDDSSLINMPVNALMEVYGANQSLIRVSSFSEPIIANQSGTVQLASTFLDEKINNITAIATFTGSEKQVSISNPITVALTYLGQIMEK